MPAFPVLLACVALLVTATSGRADSVAAAQMADKAGGPSRIPPALLVIMARTRMEAGQPREAEPLLNEALTRADAAGDHSTASLAEVALGRVAAMLGNPAAADWFRRGETRARAHDLPRTLGFVEMLRGNSAYERGQVDEAAAAYRRALPHFERANAHDDVAGVCRGLAMLVPPSEAMPLLDRGLAAARRAKNPVTEGQLLHVLSEQLFVSGRWADALVRVREALPLLEQPRAVFDQARARISLARLLRFHGDRDDARAEYDRASALLAGVPRGIGLATAWANLAVGYLYVRAPEQGIAPAERAIAIARAAGSARDETYATLALLDALLELKRPADALARTSDTPVVGPGARSFVVRRAYALSLLGRHAEAVQAADAVDSTEAGWMEAQPRTLALLAEVRRRAGQTARALEHARAAVAVLETLRGQAASADELRVGFDDGFQWVHGRLIRLLAETSAHADALLASERARARAFAELLASRSIDGAASSATWASADGLVEALRTRGGPVITYWTDEEGVLAWAVLPDGRVTHASVAVTPARLADLVSRSWNPGEPVAARSGRASAYRELYRLLVAPVAAAWTGPAGMRVAVVPHGPLFRLSFAGLVGPDGRFLIERVSPHYAPSLASMIALDTRAIGRGDPPPPLIVAAPTLTPERRRGVLAPLPGAEAEGRLVARRLGVAANDILGAGAASESAVRQRISGAGILHFATHAVVADDRPMDSFLALAGQGVEREADGLLTAEEVYGLSLQARLVVLSGCRTASGRVSGDGVIGLSRAFFAAGAPSILASLWDLPDVAAARALPAFYDAWARHGDLARAVRDAQVGLLRALRAGEVTQATIAGPIVVPAHPSVWAGLALIGAP